MTNAGPRTNGPRTAVSNVRVFDGQRLLPPGTVVIDGDRIAAVRAGAAPDGAAVVDGGGGVLLPGLIDAHVHLRDRHTLDLLSRAGVTTALDMGCPPERIAELRTDNRARTDIRSAGLPAIAPGSPHSKIPGIGARGLVSGPDQAAAFVAERVAQGADYIKMVVGDPAPSHDQATLDALVAAARAAGKLTIAHATSFEAVCKAQQAGVAVLTHVPLDRPADAKAVAGAVAADRVLIPTLTMMAAIAAQAGRSTAAARDTVTAMYRAGVPVLAGTDANDDEGVPARIPYGDSLHRELELLVEAGLTPLDALRAATSRPARYFGLADRGVIEPGRRADLLLIDGNPLQDITATRAVQRVWCAGAEVPLT